MLIRILAFILETIFFLLIGAALLRGYMNWVRVSMTDPPGRFVMALTDWIVKPLRRALPLKLSKSRIDWASVIAALLLALAYGLLWGLLFGVILGAGYWTPGLGPVALFGLLAFALKMLIRVALQVAMVLVIGYAIISWVQPGSPAYGMLARMVEPLLTPLRRIVPTIGGVDLSSLVLIVLLQIGLMILG